MQANDERVGDEAALALGVAARFHRALDSSKHLDGLQPRAEQPSARALDESLDEALHARHGPHGREATRGPRSPPIRRYRYPCPVPGVPAASMRRFGRPVSFGGRRRTRTRNGEPMTEILTESFCERCGTRYTFEPVASRRKPLKAIGTLGRGIRHFVSDPGSSIDEAFAVARTEQEQRSTATALEAFHQTFNFCLSCRQYTCADCWNPVEGRCLSCAPTADSVEPTTRLDTAVHLPPMDLAPAPARLDAGGTVAERIRPLTDAEVDAALAELRVAAKAEA